jgi:hypothetical protein
MATASFFIKILSITHFFPGILAAQPTGLTTRIENVNGDDSAESSDGAGAAILRTAAYYLTEIIEE